MGVFTAIILLVIAIGLFVAVKKKIISNETLGILANIAGVVALLAAILVFVVPTTEPKPPLSTSTPESATTPTSYLTSQSPTESLTSEAFENVPNNWSGILSVRLPTLNEIRAEVPVSIWDNNNIKVRDMQSPGIDNYSGKVQYGNEYLFPVYWCATSSDLLERSMDNIKTVFLVNEEIVPEKYVFNYNYDTNTGWKCNYHAIVIGGWSVNAEYTLDIKRILSIDLSDGQSNYKSGEYVYRIVVNVP